jgi:acid phosphatase
MKRWSLQERVVPIAVLASLLAFSFACGGGGTGFGNGGTPPASSAHVIVVVEENHSYSQVIGNSAMPYLNGLASQYGLATQYYADVHPSIGNYLMLTTGVPETLNDAFSGTISDDNVVRELVKANKTWHSYAESLPNAGYLGGDVYPYFRHHNPFTYLTDVIGTSQANNVVPFSQFASDVSADILPDYSFVIPNALNDAHDGTLAQADQWLSANIDPLIKSSAFKNNGLLVIVFDESVMSDVAHGGGHVAMVMIGPKVKKGFQSTTVYQHQSTLRLVLSTLGVTSYPGTAAVAPDMGEFF